MPLAHSTQLIPVSLKGSFLYFIRLGATAFGGPAVLVSHMHRDWVQKYRWVSQEDYDRGFALAQLAPGPLAAQLAIYLGWRTHRIVGATAAAIGLCLPAFIICVLLGALYIRVGHFTLLQSAFYGVNAAVVGIIAVNAYRLTTKSVKVRWVRVCVWAPSAVYTAVMRSESLWLMLASGLLVVSVRGWKSRTPRREATTKSLIPIFLLVGLTGAASSGTLQDIAKYFFTAGSVVFGSGYAIVPFLRGGVVERYHWLTEQQFLDAIAVAMLTPGPIVITVAFIGYLVAGLMGATIAAVATFLPCYLITIFCAPIFDKIAGIKWMESFILGLTAAAIGALAGAVVVLGRSAVTDLPTSILAGVTLVLLATKKMKEPVAILLCGVVGILIKQFV